MKIMVLNCLALLSGNSDNTKKRKRDRRKTSDGTEVTTIDLEETTIAILDNTRDVLPVALARLIAEFSQPGRDFWCHDACNKNLAISNDMRKVTKAGGSIREYQTVRVADFISVRSPLIGESPGSTFIRPPTNTAKRARIAHVPEEHFMMVAYRAVSLHLTAQGLRLRKGAAADGDFYKNQYSWNVVFGQDENTDRWYKSIGVVNSDFSDWSQPIGRDLAGNSWAINTFNGFRYHQNHADRFTEPMHSGQYIRLTVDFSTRELKLEVDGKDFGVVFQGIGESVALACTLYNTHDWMELQS